MTYTNCTQRYLPIYIKVIFEQKALNHLPKLYQIGANSKTEFLYRFCFVSGDQFTKIPKYHFMAHVVVFVASVLLLIINGNMVKLTLLEIS